MSKYPAFQSLSFRRDYIQRKTSQGDDFNGALIRFIARESGCGVEQIKAEIRAARGGRSVKAKAEPSYHPIPGWIYILEIPTGHYKIGRTRSLATRLAQIGIQLPFRAALYHSIQTIDTVWAEGHLHQRFADHRTNGEWFQLTSDDLAWLTAHDRLDP